MKFRLRALRLDRGLTQTQVAEAIGISVGLYNQLESGKRRMNATYMESIAKLFCVSPADLIEATGDPLFQEMLDLMRDLSPYERKMLVASARGLLDLHRRTEK